MICVFYYMTGTPEGSTESGFMEKPGIEPATPKGIALIHYTTGASLWVIKHVRFVFVELCHMLSHCCIDHLCTIQLHSGCESEMSIA